MKRYLSGTVDIDIIILNNLRDYEIMPVLLVNKTIANIVKNTKFWQYRIRMKLKRQIFIRSNKIGEWIKIYRHEKMVIARKLGYTPKHGSSIQGLEMAINLDIRLSTANIEDMIIRNRIYFWEKRPNDAYGKLFCILPKVWYDTVKIKIIRGYNLFEFFDEYIKIENRDVLQTIFNNFLYRHQSFHYKKEPISARTSPNFFANNLHIIHLLLSANIQPSITHLQTFFKPNYLSSSDKQTLSSILPQLHDFYLQNITIAKSYTNSKSYK